MQDTRISFVSSNDIHHQETLLTLWDQYYAQITPGAFSGTVGSRSIGQFKLFSERMNRAVLQRGALPRSRLGFGVVRQADGSATICGEEAGKESLLVFSGSSGFDFLSPSSFEFLGVEVDLDAPVDPVLSALLQSLDRILCAGPRTLPLRGRGAAMLCRLVADALQDDASPRMVFTSAENADSFGKWLIGLVLDLLPEQESDSTAGRRRELRHWDVIGAICTLVRDAEWCPTSVSELTEYLGVSRRTLQTACIESTGLGPLGLLRTLRLGEARRTLREGGSVTDAATRYCFWHLGYFARDYRKMFGELPSATAAQHRRDRPVRRPG